MAKILQLLPCPDSWTALDHEAIRVIEEFPVQTGYL